MTAGAMPAARVTVVVPIYNKLGVLEPCLESVTREAARLPGVEVELVDNGSTDGSYELAATYATRPGVRLHRWLGHPISAVRNWGARQGTGAIISFLDCDVTLPEGYFGELERVFAETGTASTGCECGLPPAPGWIERTWHQLNVRTTDGERHYINSANFAVRRDVFESVGGFPEDFETSEDYEYCRRIRAAGLRVYQSRSLEVAHLDNPQTLGAFFRKMRWHGVGMWSSGGRRLNKPALMTLANLLLLLAAVGVLLWPGPLSWSLRLVVAVLAALAVPVMTLAFRLLQVRRSVPVLPSLFLLELFYLARAAALPAGLAARARPRSVGG